MITEKITVLVADEGFEIYKISDPSVYGKSITLAKSDSPDNWAERPKTIIEEIPEI